MPVVRRPAAAPAPSPAPGTCGTSTGPASGEPRRASVPRTDDTCPARMIRSTWPSQFWQLGLRSGDGTTCPSATYRTYCCPSASVWCSISYDCSQPCPQRMQANEYDS